MIVTMSIAKCFTIAGGTSTSNSDWATPMAKTRRWIECELLGDGGLRIQFEHRLDLHTGVLSSEAYANRVVASEIQHCETQWGRLEQMVSELLSWKRGIWFYAGWVDQAALYVGKVLGGDNRLFASMLREIDTDQTDQGGDMMLGFVADDEDWLFVLDVSPQNGKFVVGVRSNSKKDIEAISTRFPS